MQISYNADEKQAADADTGMVIAFNSFGPYPREREVFFTLKWKAQSITLKAGFDYDERRIMNEAAYPFESGRPIGSATTA